MALKNSDLNKVKNSLHKKEIAFLIGNGINRFRSHHNDRSWDGILNSLLKNFSELNGKIQSGISRRRFFQSRRKISYLFYLDLLLSYVWQEAIN